MKLPTRSGEEPFALLWQVEMQAPLKVLVLIATIGIAVGIENLYRILRRQRPGF